MSNIKEIRCLDEVTALHGLYFIQTDPTKATGFGKGDLRKRTQDHSKKSTVLVLATIPDLKMDAHEKELKDFISGTEYEYESKNTVSKEMASLNIIHVFKIQDALERTGEMPKPMLHIGPKERYRCEMTGRSLLNLYEMGHIFKPDYQRAFVEDKVKIIADKFENVDAIMTEMVFATVDTRMVCVDGQHRLEALKRVSDDALGHLFPVTIYGGLTEIQQSDLYTTINTQTPHNQIDWSENRNNQFIDKAIAEIHERMGYRCISDIIPFDNQFWKGKQNARSIIVGKALFKLKFNENFVKAKLMNGEWSFDPRNLAELLIKRNDEILGNYDPLAPDPGGNNLAGVLTPLGKNGIKKYSEAFRKYASKLKTMNDKKPFVLFWKHTKAGRNVDPKGFVGF